MNLIFLPDSAAMLVLMGVLLWARRRYRDQSVDTWLLGLSFILVENLAAGLYRGPLPGWRSLHIIALDGYVLAGLTFAWAAGQDLVVDRTRRGLALLSSTAMLIVATMYCVQTASRPFEAVMAVTLVGGLAIVAGVGRSRIAVRDGLLHVATWLPMLVLASRHNLRGAVYWGLTCGYLLVALAFRGRVRRDGIGGLVTVAGFAIWAFCFLLHPWARNQPLYGPLLEQVWNMQKFLVILGMLLMLLEEQTRRRAEEALHDVLTGLPNRRLFEDRLSQALERANRAGTFCAVFSIDLDGFKQVNDRYGHLIGDEVLQIAARQLGLKVRATDTLARLGGDEFIVIVSDIVYADACRMIAQSLRDSVLEGRHDAAPELALRCSVGFALYPRDAIDPLTLCQVADTAMYESKRCPRQEVEVLV